MIGKTAIESLIDVHYFIGNDRVHKGIDLTIKREKHTCSWTERGGKTTLTKIVALIKPHSKEGCGLYGKEYKQAKP